MKKTALITLIATALGVSSISSGAQVTINIDTKPHQNMVPTQAFFHSNYEDLRAKCEGAISDLRKSFEQNMDLGNQEGEWGQAANNMTADLVKKAREIEDNIDYQSKANPNTVIAILEAAKIATAAVEAIDAAPIMFQKDVLKGKIVSNLMTFIFDAYEKLDNTYFYVRIERCRYDGGCYNVGSSAVDGKYYRALGDVARGLLNVYFNNHNIMATNTIELLMAAQFASSAANVLDYSNFRRDLATPIVLLYDTAAYASSAVSHDLKRQYQDVKKVNSWIQQALFQIPRWN